MQRTYLIIPGYILLVIQLTSSILMLTGLLADSYVLLIPFQLNTVLNLMATMSIAILLMVTTDKSNSHLFPIYAFASVMCVGVYLWFIIISCLTFVMLRDKYRLTESELNIYRGEMVEKPVENTMERVNSATF